MLLGVTELWGKIDLFPSSSVAPGKSRLQIPASPVIKVPVAGRDDGCGVPGTNDMRAVLAAPPTLGCFVIAALCCNYLWQGL